MFELTRSFKYPARRRRVPEWQYTGDVIAPRRKRIAQTTKNGRYRILPRGVDLSSTCLVYVRRPLSSVRLSKPSDYGERDSSALSGGGREGGGPSNLQDTQSGRLRPCHQRDQSCAMHATAVSLW